VALSDIYNQTCIIDEQINCHLDDVSSVFTIENQTYSGFCWGDGSTQPIEFSSNFIGLINVVIDVYDFKSYEINLIYNSFKLQFLVNDSSCSFNIFTICCTHSTGVLNISIKSDTQQLLVLFDDRLHQDLIVLQYHASLIYNGHELFGKNSTNSNCLGTSNNNVTCNFENIGAHISQNIFSKHNDDWIVTQGQLFIMSTGLGVPFSVTSEGNYYNYTTSIFSLQLPCVEGFDCQILNTYKVCYSCYVGCDCSYNVTDIITKQKDYIYPLGNFPFGIEGSQNNGYFFIDNYTGQPAVTYVVSKSINDTI
jgi:hypothetical protein